MTTAPETALTRHEIKDGGRVVKFTGELLAKVSSERRTAPRWTEMELYRTERGMFVIHRIGRSIVFHISDCLQARQSRMPYGHEVPGGVKPLDLREMAPCPNCGPSRQDPPETLRFERTRSWAGIAEDADRAIEMLHRNDNGRRSLDWIASDLLELASEIDAEIRSAYRVEVVI